MSIEAGKWRAALASLDFDVVTVAGTGSADVLIEGLGSEPDGAVGADLVGAKLAAAFEGCDVVIADNICSLPLNPMASAAVARALRGRPAVLRHHDLAWQRPERPWAGWSVPDDRRWAHVAVNSISVEELATRQGIDATRVPNRFSTTGWLEPSDHRGTVVLHPVRAIPRKNVPAAVALAEQLGATYWLTGPAEDGYDATLERLLASTRCPVRHEPATSMVDAYALADVVAFPSTSEGFGNPVIEASLARRPVAVGRYPVLVADFEPLGFRWLDAADLRSVERFVSHPDLDVLDANRSLAIEHFDLADLPATSAPC